MKYLWILILGIFAGGAAKGQQPTDFYFRKPLPEQCKEIQKIPVSLQGRWQSKKDTLRSVIITDKKIYTQYKHVMFLAEKELKKSGYTLKDGYLYGFSKHDSLPASVVNDTVIFCYISDHELVNLELEEAPSAVAEMKNGLLISKPTDSVYSYTMVRVEKGELQLMEVDHETQIDKVVGQIKPEVIQDESGETIAYLADPDKKQMQKFIDAGFFNVVQRCGKIIAP